MAQKWPKNDYFQKAKPFPEQASALQGYLKKPGFGYLFTTSFPCCRGMVFSVQKWHFFTFLAIFTQKKGPLCKRVKLVVG